MIPYQEGSSSPHIRLGDNERVAILRMLVDGWRKCLSRDSVNATCGEIAITDCLLGGMRQALKEGVVAWGNEIVVARGTESLSMQGKRGRTDISIYFRRIREEYEEHDSHAIVECKRIYGDDADLCRLYVTEGINRFASGKYADRHAFGFMAGYLLKGRRRQCRGGCQPISNGSRSAEGMLGLVGQAVGVA